ncbi:response regulator [Candidatus Saccharibacteria bacterium]|nr:response regulator [Candidatus Saccharibacteria bacterium]
MAKILLVEDDNNLREIFEMRLQAEGYETLAASDGEEALVVALKEKPELIIADVMMPKMSGFEMLETLRATPDTNQVKVVMMTALGQAEDQARGERLGVVKYLVKSQVTLEDFVRVVKEVLQPGGATDGQQVTSNTELVQGDTKSSNQESEQTMPPQNSTPPTNDAPDQGSDANPISGPAPASGGQMSSAQAQDKVNSQINDFASSTPVGDAGSTPSSSSASGTGSDIPVEPAPQPPVAPPNPDGAPPEGPSTPGPSAPSSGV